MSKNGYVSLALYKGKGDIVNGFIRWWTGSIYSHCELVVDGLCYSSSGMDKGVRSKQIDLDSGNWDLVEIPWAKKEEILAYFKATDHYRYGYWSLVLSQLFNLGRGQKEALFCSEWCASALNIPCPSSFNPSTAGNLIIWVNQFYTKY